MKLARCRALRSTLVVNLRIAVVASVFISVACAQRWELGGVAGYGFYRNGTVTSGPGSETAGIVDRFTAGGLLCEDLFQHFSGEVRYLYGDGHPFLSMPGYRADMNGRTHTLTYDALLQVFDRDHRLRPYAALGIGGKGYEATGPAPSLHSAPQIGTLVHTTQWTVVGDFGGGIKYRLHKNAVFRVEVRDYISPLPDRLIVALGNGKTAGLLHQITPLAGLSYSF